MHIDYIDGCIIMLLFLMATYLMNWFSFAEIICEFNIHFMFVILLILSMSIIWPVILIGAFWIIMWKFIYIINEPRNKR